MIDDTLKPCSLAESFTGYELLDIFIETVRQNTANEITIPMSEAVKIVNEFINLRNEVTESQNNEIWGFYEDTFPVYTNRKDSHPELSNIVRVEELNKLVDILKTNRQEIEELMQIIKMIRNSNLSNLSPGVTHYIDKILLNESYGEFGRKSKL